MWKTQRFLENPEFISAESMSWCREIVGFLENPGIHGKPRDLWKIPNLLHLETLGFLENSRISGKSRIYWRHWDFHKTQGFLENPKFIPADHPGLRFPKILGCPLGVSSPHPSPLFLGAPKESPSSGIRELAGCGNWRDLGIPAWKGLPNSLFFGSPSSRAAPPCREEPPHARPFSDAGPSGGSGCSKGLGERRDGAAAAAGAAR